MSELVDAARMLRAYLSALLADDDDSACTAADMDVKLGRLLEAANGGAEVDGQLAAVFAAHEAIQNWVSATLGNDGLVPPQVMDRLRERAAGYEPLAGDTAGPTLQRYECPVNGDVVWYRITLAEPIPACPGHQVSLALVDPP